LDINKNYIEMHGQRNIKFHLHPLSIAQFTGHDVPYSLISKPGLH